MLTFQQIIFKLQTFWADKGCTVIQPFDMEVGAGTSHPATCLRALGPSLGLPPTSNPAAAPKTAATATTPTACNTITNSKSPSNPPPPISKTFYLDSLRELGIDPKVHDIRFVEDDWENPTLGAWGLGWEVWLNGMEVTQFTYFQQVGGIDCTPVLGEITYGIERLAMYLQGVENVYDLVWAKTPDGNTVSYGDVYHQNEVEQSTYNFEYSDADWLLRQFNDYEAQAKRLFAEENADLALPAYELVLKAGHTFNLLDARGAISVTERATYIGRIRALSRAVAQKYIESREKLGFPLIKK